MRSFSTLSLLFTAALSAFTYAAPAGTPDLKLPFDTTAITGLTSGASALGARATTPGLAVVFTTLQTQISPLAAELTFLTPANATAANITPIVGQIKDCLLTATVSVKALVGLELDVILAPIEGTVILTVAAVAELVGGVLCILFAAIGCLLKVVVADVSVIVLPILVDLCVVVACLLQVVFGLVGGLLAAVLLILTPTVIAVIKLLACTELLLCLGIKL
ncbi:hypothetical protein BJ138DRAFT_1127927 [Hygrophoropsis aurantiaca]|uniref:Uncharacterized protein n=1 Tax=Hygrophoropsis aurantiaca TaxID=72124 RepID=A0ACB8A764_9AGAM|nr:hypothetical protein BJ138DRAFT_1127927 [Hygrophoropsis aurantiaca]